MSETTLLSRETPVSFRVPWYALVVRATARPLFRLLFRILCRVRIEGLENVPNQGSYIIAHNHISLFEPPLLCAFWPMAPEAISGADVFDRPLIKFFVRAYYAIPVHRGEYDRVVIDTMLDILASGRPLVIAPEGGRGHKPGLRHARPGVAYVTDRAQVQVVPVGITGTMDDMLSRALRAQCPELTMHIGKPFTLPSIAGRGEDRRHARQANADLVMRHIASLLPEEYRGVYQPI